MNRLLKRMSWKTDTGKWDSEEVKGDLILLTILTVVVTAAVYYG